MAIDIVNKHGRLVGWNNARAILMGRTLEGITELTYDDEIEKETVYAAGRMPIGVEEKQYKATASITLLKEETDILSRSLPRGGRFQDIAPFDVTVAYVLADGSMVTDVLRNCQFTKRGSELKSGEGKIMYKYDLLVTHIDWDVL